MSNYTIVVNSNNVVGTTNSSFRYNFISGAVQFDEGTEISLSSATIPYSWFNITSNYGNKTLKLFWPVGISGYSQYDISIPDGFYSAADLDRFLQQFMINNGLYLINDTASNVVYLRLFTNETYYSNQILSYVVPSTLPTGWTAPNTWPGFPTTSRCPYIVIDSNLSVNLGFNKDTQYPVAGNTTNQSVLSPNTPNSSQVNSLVLRCNLVDNSATMPSDIIDAIPITSTFGSNIVYEPKYQKSVRIKPGRYSSFQIELLDQNLNQIICKDPNSLFVFTIHQK